MVKPEYAAPGTGSTSRSLANSARRRHRGQSVRSREQGADGIRHVAQSAPHRLLLRGSWRPSPNDLPTRRCGEAPPGRRRAKRMRGLRPPSRRRTPGRGRLRGDGFDLRPIIVPRCRLRLRTPLKGANLHFGRKEAPMDQVDRFLCDGNISRFSDQLRYETNPARQETLKRLLIEEENRFRRYRRPLTHRAAQPYGGRRTHRETETTDRRNCKQQWRNRQRRADASNF